MQVTSRVTELTAIATTELAVIGKFLLGLGTVAFAIMAFYGVYKWREKATHKRDKLESIIEEHQER
ncbi:MAG: hypothetical protein QNK36_21680 [Colwellia sp.]|nr:hypothetical protein [Colwellia sp.]